MDSYPTRAEMTSLFIIKGSMLRDLSLWMKDRKTQDGVEYLPIYMAPCLAEEGL